MNTYKLTLSYDGSRYLGWRRIAANDNTIQYILEHSISRLEGRRVNVEGACVTIAGAHARGQIASVQLEKEYDPQKLKGMINRTLPDDIRVVDVEIAEDEFHARDDAKAFKYEYYIDHREKPDVFARRYCYHYPEELNLDQMKAAADILVGHKDFSSFVSDDEGEDNVCYLMKVNLLDTGDKIRITYYANKFPEGMVEFLTGTLLEIGSGKTEVRKLPVIIAAQDNRAAGEPVPSKGTFLRKVYY